MSEPFDKEIVVENSQSNHRRFANGVADLDLA